MYTQHQLNRARKLTYVHSGITLGDNKDVMIANRLDKLKRALGKSDIDEILTICENGCELDTFISVFTTNKTNFFRESFHFDDLKDRAIKEAIKNGQNDFKVYCSASSTGEEPYSILMTIEEAKKEYNSSINYSLIATDIDKEVLAHAKNGIYEYKKNIYDFPEWIKPSDYFKRKEHPNIHGDYLIKAKDTLTKKVKFEQMNLMSQRYPFKEGEFDVVFCRNVLIYFNQSDQNAILKKLFKTLKMGGTLYLGHSENPLELAPYLQRCGQNVFIKKKESI